MGDFMIKKRLPLFAAVILSITGLTYSRAEDSPQRISQNAELKGQVQVLEVQLQHVNDVGVDLKKALQSTSSLYDEVTRRPVTIGVTPNVVGATVLNVPTPRFDMGASVPARKEEIDRGVAQINDTVALLKKDVSAIQSGELELKWPAGTEEELNGLMNDWMTAVNRAYDRLGDLKNATAQQPYDNAAIAKTTSLLRKDISRIEKIRKAIYAKLKKAANKS
jgi:hypothetical protein